MSTRTVLIFTDEDGAFSQEEPFFGTIIGALFTKDELSDFTTIDVIDATTGVTVHSEGELDTDKFWQPGTRPMVFGRLRVEVTNGGPTATGQIRFLTET